MAAVDTVTSELWDLHLRLEQEVRLMRAAQLQCENFGQNRTLDESLILVGCAQQLEGEVDAALQAIIDYKRRAAGG